MHAVAPPTKQTLGLDQVGNTSDANKPISTATQTALDLKVDAVSGKGLSDQNFTADEKAKLAGLQSSVLRILTNRSQEAGTGILDINYATGNVVQFQSSDVTMQIGSGLLVSANNKIQVGTTGYYRFIFDYAADDNSAGSTRISVQMGINGVAHGLHRTNTVNSLSYMQLILFDVALLNAGDLVDFRFFNNTNERVAIDPSLSIIAEVILGVTL